MERLPPGGTIRKRDNNSSHRPPQLSLNRCRGDGLVMTEEIWRGRADRRLVEKVNDRFKYNYRITGLQKYSDDAICLTTQQRENLEFKLGS